MRRVFALTLALLLAGCSATRSVYQRPGYPLGSEPAVKHIAVKAWAPAEPAVLAPVLAQVAADFVSLHKDYLVHAVEPMSRSWGDGCGDREAVLFVQLLRLARDGDTVDLDLAVELSRCSDGALLWRAEGSRKANANNEDLGGARELVRSEARGRSQALRCARLRAPSGSAADAAHATAQRRRGDAEDSSSRRQPLRER